MSDKKGGKFKGKQVVVAVTKGGTTNVKPPADTAGDWIEIDCNVQNYPGSITTLRASFATSRTGAKWVKVKPAGTGECVFLCLDAKSMYVNAIRGLNKVWWYFSDATGCIPTGASKGQDGHYSHLSNTSKTSAQKVNKALASLNTYIGVDVDPQVRCDLWMIVQLVAESARFTSVCTAMTNYLQAGFFELTSTEETVKNWQALSKANDPDVMVRCLE